MKTKYREFIWGFAQRTGLDTIDADEAWAAFSRQLSDREREQIESGGQDAGWEQGELHNQLAEAK